MSETFSIAENRPTEIAETDVECSEPTNELSVSNLELEFVFFPILDPLD
jgi:hypothetical protein